MDNRLLRVEEVAIYCCVRPNTVYSWLQRGLLTAIKVNNKVVRIRESDLRKFILKHKVPAKKK